MRVFLIEGLDDAAIEERRRGRAIGKAEGIAGGEGVLSEMLVGHAIGNGKGSAGVGDAAMVVFA
ncbi:hypothetical protein D9M70_544400 [compost metagenome]